MRKFGEFAGLAQDGSSRAVLRREDEFPPFHQKLLDRFCSLAPWERGRNQPHTDSLVITGFDPCRQIRHPATAERVHGMKQHAGRDHPNQHLAAKKAQTE
jgi:hypothetical protein